MTVKVIKLSEGSKPMLMGVERLPLSWQEPAQNLVEKHAERLAVCRPYHLGAIAARVRKHAACLEDKVDADLLDDFHEASLKNKPRLGATLYRLDADLLPV